MANTYRPPTFQEFVGQHNLKKRLLLAADAAAQTGNPMPSVLLLGPPGVGKTSLAHIIATTLGVEMEAHIPPVSDMMLRAIVMAHEGVFFIDEIHRFSKKEQEYLLPLLEDGYLEDDRGRRFHSQNLTVIGATTEGHQIITPLYDRFSIKPPFQPYSEDEMARIVQAQAEHRGLTVDDEWAKMIANASRGVPRNAASLVTVAAELQAIYDDTPTYEEVLDHASITEDGLDLHHLEYLDMLQRLGGRAGLNTMTQMLNIPSAQVENLETHLMKMGYIERTPSGRDLTPMGMRFLRERNSRE